MFFLFSSLVLCTATVSIDIGAENFKVTTVEHSHRIPQSKIYPAYFAIWNESNASYIKEDSWKQEDLNESRWLFFEAAKAKLQTNPLIVVKGFMPLSGKSRGLENRLIFTAMLKEICMKSAALNPTNPIVFTVPSSMDRTDRYILQECADVLSLNVVAVIDQHVAMAMKFLVHNATTFRNKTRHVMFVDIGAETTWYAAFNFSSIQCNVTHVNSSTDEEYNQTHYIKNGEQLSLETVNVGGSLLDGQFIDALETASGVKNDTFYKLEAQRLKAEYQKESRIEQNYTDPNFTLGINFYEVTINPLIPTLSLIIQQAKHFNVDLIAITGGTSTFPLLKDYFTSDDVGINVSFIPNGATSSFLALTDGNTFGINSFANCISYLEYNETKNKISDLKSHTKEHLVLNMSAHELPRFLITENGKVLSNFTFDVPPFADPNEIVTLEFCIDNLSIPNVFSAFLGDCPLDFYVARPPWMMSEEQFNSTCNFIKFFEIVVQDRIKRQRLMLKKQKKFIEKMIKQGKWNNLTQVNKSVFNITKMRKKFEDKTKKENQEL